MPNSNIQQVLDLYSFKVMTDIQSKVYPIALKGKDIIAISKTGTGKTHAYLFPLFQLINTEEKTTQALIILPTLELAVQIYNVALKFRELNPDFTVLLLAKGTQKGSMSSNLVIGTVGKLSQHLIKDSTLRLDHIRHIVVDEADMMLEKSNLELDELLNKCKAEVQMLVFSATIPNNIKPFIKQYMQSPLMVEVLEDKLFKPQIEHILIPLKHNGIDFITKLMPFINPFMCLIFVHNSDELKQLDEIFNSRSIKHVVLYGEQDARERKQVMTQIRQQQITYIISTDVASRGLDIPEVTDIISVGFPKDLDFYIHRAGRTGRAGKTGTIYTFYKEADSNSILKLIDRKINFKHKRLSETGLVEMKPFNTLFTFQKKSIDKELAHILTRKNEQVKPNYKKKKDEEIEKLKRKRKRDMIQKSIKVQQKQKSRLEQIEKKNPK